jgi:hypothetical protein
MWNLKCKILPVIIGATGIVTRSLRKHLEAEPGKRSIDSLQKTAVYILQPKIIGFYNRDEKCLQRGTNWVFNEAVCASSLNGYIFSVFVCSL